MHIKKERKNMIPILNNFILERSGQSDNER